MSFRMVVVPVTHDVRQHAASEQRRAELQRILDVRVLRIEVNDSPVDTGHVVFAHIDLHGQYSIDCDILDRSTRTVHRTLSRTLSVFDFFSKKVIHRVLLDYIRCIGYTIYIINNIHPGMTTTTTIQTQLSGIPAYIEEEAENIALDAIRIFRYTILA